MRIVVVSDVIYPWTKGGLEIRYDEIYTRLAREHEIHFITMKYPGMPSDSFIKDGMHIHCVCKAPEGLYKSGRRKILPAIVFALSILKFLVNWRFDVVDSSQTPFFPNLILSIYRLMSPNTRIISTWYEHWTLVYWQEYLGLIRGTVGFLLQQLSARVPHGILCISETTEKALRRIGNRANGMLGVVWCGADSEAIANIRKRTTPRLGRLITVGRLIPEKRVDRFIDLVRLLKAEFPHVSGVIVGDGPERRALEHQALGLEMKFTGFLENHWEVLEETAKSSVYVSFSEREGFNIAALEACQLGLIAFARLKLFDHKNLHQLDKRGWSRIYESVTAKPNAKSSIDPRFSWDRIAEQIESVLSSCTKTI